MLLIISVIGFVSSFYAISYIGKYTADRKFFILFSLMVAGMNGIVVSGDIFNIFVFLEIAAISSYALVAFGIEKQELEASFKYQILGGVASLIILLSIGFIYWQTGTLNIADISSVIPFGSLFTKFVAILFIVGFGLMMGMPIGMATGSIDLVSWNFSLWYLAGTAVVWVVVIILTRFLNKEKIILSSRGS